MVDYIPVEKGMTIRQPSTANLMIDSNDRNSGNFPSSGNFTIQKNASILNGFFTRIGLTELVLDWYVPNIQTGFNDTLTVTVGGSGGGTYSAVLTQGMYTVAGCLGYAIQLLNNQQASFVFSVSSTYGICEIRCSPAGAPATYRNLTFTITPLLALLGITAGIASEPTIVPENANIQLYRYLDFVSPELTYAQDLKDGTTATQVRTVIARWYMSWDNPPPLDALGFPVLMGYTAFQTRRLFNPPKQIRWEPNLPIGNLSFQVYTPGGGTPFTNTNFDWLMTLQVSEV